MHQLLRLGVMLVLTPLVATCTYSLGWDAAVQVNVAGSGANVDGSCQADDVGSHVHLLQTGIFVGRDLMAKDDNSSVQSKHEVEREEHDEIVREGERERERERKIDCLEKAVVRRILQRQEDVIDGAKGNFLAGRETGSFLVDTFFENLTDDEVRAYAMPTATSGSLLDILALGRSLFSGSSSAKLEADVLDNYVTFTRFAKGPDKYSCDWCSLVNGVSELQVATLVNMSSYEVAPPECDLQHAEYNDSSGFLPTEGQLACFDVDPGLVDPKVVWSALFYRNKVEYIEQKWCPFKHLRQLDFNRSYYAFSAELDADLKQAQAILREKDRISGEDVSCDKCNKVINDELVAYAHHEHEESIFDDAMFGASYMDFVACAFGISCETVRAAIDLPVAHSHNSGIADADALADYEFCLAMLTGDKRE